MHMSHYRLQLCFWINIQSLLCSGCCLFLLLEHNHSVLLDDKQHMFCKLVVVGSFLHCDLESQVGFRHPQQSFPFLNILILSFKGFSMIDSYLSRACFFWQVVHNSRSVVLQLSAVVTCIVNLFFLCLGFCCEPFDDLSQC